MAMGEKIQRLLCVYLILLTRQADAGNDKWLKHGRHQAAPVTNMHCIDDDLICFAPISRLRNAYLALKKLAIGLNY